VIDGWLVKTGAGVKRDKFLFSLQEIPFETEKKAIVVEDSEAVLV
jgi:hypothetical protein